MRNRIREYTKKKGISRKGISWLLELTAPYRGQILGLVLLRCVSTALGIGMAVINKQIIDRAAGAFADFAWTVFLAVACTILSMAGGIVLNLVTVRITEKYSNYIRGRMYERILGGDWMKRSGYHSEELLSRLTSDIQAVTGGVVQVAVSLSAVTLQFVMAFLVLWNMDRSLAVFAVVTGPAIAVFSFIAGRKIKKIQEQVQQAEADYRVFLQEQINQADVIKIFEQERSSLDQLGVLQQKHLYWGEKKNRCTVLLRTSVRLMFSASYLFAFVTGAVKIAEGAITYGTMTAFLSLVSQIQTPVSSMSQIFSRAVGVLASAGRVQEISELPQEERAESPEQPPLSGASVGIRLENVKFSYNREKEVFQGVSLDIRPGSFTVLMGPSGVGKTTLIRMLLGFLAPGQGKVLLYDQKENRAVCSPETRRYISYVPQGDTLFSGTIAANLRAGKADATEEQMRGALEAACALEFVDSLPEGLHTEIGEKGYGLSGGQAQRIAIARAIIRPAALLILDEATSSLDEYTEKRILDRLAAERGEKTCLVISHRSSVKQYADQILYFEGQKDGKTAGTRDASREKEREDQE